MSHFSAQRSSWNPGEHKAKDSLRIDEDRIDGPDSPSMGDTDHLRHFGEHLFLGHSEMGGGRR